MKIDNKTARKIVHDLVMELDYDVYKSYFVEDCFEGEPEEIEDTIQKLINVVIKAASK